MPNTLISSVEVPIRSSYKPKPSSQADVSRIFQILYHPPPALVPTKTTNTAAYAAVMPNVSAFEALNPTDTTPEKSTTATDVVIKRLFGFWWVRMISIGTTSERPPVMATMKRASRSTEGDIILGLKWSRNAVCPSSLSNNGSCLVISSSVHVSFPGRILLKKRRSGSLGAIDRVFGFFILIRPRLNNLSMSLLSGYDDGNL